MRLFTLLAALMTVLAVAPPAGAQAKDKVMFVLDWVVLVRHTP